MTTQATPAKTSRPAPSPALGLTLGPVDADAFLAEYWERQPLVIERGEERRFHELLAPADVERLLCESGIRMPGFRLVKDGAQVPLSTYTEDIPWRPGSFSGTPVVERVAEEFARGATLVLQALHLYWPAAALYCRELEKWLGCPVQANAYQTPAAARGFAVHHDTHDVFVLQVAGRKRWRVYDPVLELPLSGQRWSPQLGDPGEAIRDFTLEAGDTLYLPRGWPHEATTSQDESLHLTIGVHPPTRLDALRAALQSSAEDDVEFRRTPNGRWNDPEGVARPPRLAADRGRAGPPRAPPLRGHAPADPPRPARPDAGPRPPDGGGPAGAPRDRDLRTGADR